MVRCSFCNHENEEGDGFCQKCKTDLTIPAANAPAIATAEPITDTLHVDKMPLVQALGPVGSPVADPKRSADPQREAVTKSPSLSAMAADDGAPSTVITPALDALPEECKPRLVVLRGEKVDVRYPIYAGKNYIGRTDEKPVDIDLENQEPADRIWTSRQHAIINFENGVLTIEDLNSLNGTFVNRTRVHPGQLRTLQVNDIIQIGTVHMRIVLG